MKKKAQIKKSYYQTIAIWNLAIAFSRVAYMKHMKDYGLGKEEDNE